MKDDGKLHTFCEIVIIIRIIFSFLHVTHVAMRLKEVQTIAPTFTTVMPWLTVGQLG